MFSNFAGKSGEFVDRGVNISGERVHECDFMEDGVDAAIEQIFNSLKRKLCVRSESDLIIEDDSISGFSECVFNRENFAVQVKDIEWFKFRDCVDICVIRKGEWSGTALKKRFHSGAQAIVPDVRAVESRVIGEERFREP